MILPLECFQICTVTLVLPKENPLSKNVGHRGQNIGHVRLSDDFLFSLVQLFLSSPKKILYPGSPDTNSLVPCRYSSFLFILSFICRQALNTQPQVSTLACPLSSGPHTITQSYISHAPAVLTLFILTDTTEGKAACMIL